MKRNSGMVKIPKSLFNDIMDFVNYNLGVSHERNFKQIASLKQAMFSLKKTLKMNLPVDDTIFEIFQRRNDVNDLLGTKELSVQNKNLLEAIYNLERKMTILDEYFKVIGPLVDQYASQRGKSLFSREYLVSNYTYLKDYAYLKGRDFYTNLKVELDILNQYSTNSGAFNDTSVKLVLRIPEDLTYWVSAVKQYRDLQGALTHELTHFIQYIMRKVTNVSTWGESPVSMRDKGVRQVGGVLEDLEMARDLHSLDDREFYSNLNSIYVELSYLIEKHPEINIAKMSLAELDAFLFKNLDMKLHSTYALRLKKVNVAKYQKVLKVLKAMFTKGKGFFV